MNRKEYVASRLGVTTELKYVRELLKQWKVDRNLTCRCCIHHRDDNDEVRAYNEAHYELWGFNLDGTFEYGKYVVFMTTAEHNVHHFKGEKSPWFGKHQSESIRKKNSEAHKGKTPWNKGISLPDRSGENHPFYGKHHSEESKRRISSTLKGHRLPQETKDKMSEARKARLVGLRLLYNMYKNNGGDKKWNDFQKELATGDITFSDYTITIFNNK